MPRVIAFRVGFLWVACTLNDYDEASDGSAGWSRDHAIRRALASIARSWGAEG